MVASGNQLMQAHIERNLQVSLIDLKFVGLQSVVAVDFDSVDERIYFADTKVNKIYSTTYDGEDVKVVSR